MLGQRRRRWPNIKTTLGQRGMFIGYLEYNMNILQAALSDSWRHVCKVTFLRLLQLTVNKL